MLRVVCAKKLHTSLGEVCSFYKLLVSLYDSYFAAGA